jgi:hypothetical protein
MEIAWAIFLGGIISILATISIAIPIGNNLFGLLIGVITLLTLWPLWTISILADRINGDVERS